MPQANTASRPAWLPGEQRLNERTAAHVVVALEEPGRNQSATLVNLSAAGCRVQATERLSLGTFVTVRLTDGVAATGWVAWSRGLDAGIDFAAPLDESAVRGVIG